MLPLPENSKNNSKFLFEKRAVFRELKEIKRLRGGVLQYAAQASVQIDAEIAEKGRFSNKNYQRGDQAGCRQSLSKAVKRREPVPSARIT